MRCLSRTARPGVSAPNCVVCLPGAYQVPEDFLAAGFDAGVRERALPIDLLFVDVEMQHVGDRRFRERLKREIVVPARASGCRFLWFAGISLGGFVALDYAASHPGDLDGLCLLAPYLGSRIITAEIAQASGVAAWSPGELARDDEERRIWRFLQDQGRDPRSLYLGYGREDRFAAAQGLLAQSLPSDAVDVVPGGHDWRTWTALWGNFLDSRFACA